MNTAISLCRSIIAQATDAMLRMPDSADREFFQGEKSAARTIMVELQKEPQTPHPAPSPSEVGPEVVETLRSAVRRIIARCEAIEDVSNEQLSKDQTEAASGFLRGERHLAKSIRRELHDLTRAAAVPEPVDTDGDEADKLIKSLGEGDECFWLVLAAIKRGRALEKEAGR
jgi:hypothetical protein